MGEVDRCEEAPEFMYYMYSSQVEARLIPFFVKDSHLYNIKGESSAREAHFIFSRLLLSRRRVVTKRYKKKAPAPKTPEKHFI